ncbi:NAD-binding protein [Actinocatenispora rupis]|uniref:Potassium transporter TrkA n=1 Tax=Actinocatenispora rupis TaxID=519421 RepID=A0A8J3NC42_9ACTN|nr:NAD(P)-binding protein [Actinocatenispora rupis]GID13701.1 potassium transporter TrkA [Actinocatenispora rupis]
MPPITPKLPTRPWRRPRGRHIVVCGANQLTYRLVEELVTRHGEYVTVIVPSRQANKAPDIAALDGVRIVVAERLDSKAFREAGLSEARSLALAADDDMGNLHAALRAQEFNRRLRLVIRMSNANLRVRIHELFADCTALHDASTAAPAFVAAALDQPAPVRLPSRTLMLTTRRDVPPELVVCGLASTSDRPGQPHLLPDTTAPDDLVLAMADGQRDPERRPHRLPTRLRHVLRLSVRRSLAMVVAVLFGLIIAGIALRVGLLHQPLGYSLYDTVLTIAGSGDPSEQYSGLEMVIQSVTMVGGIALVPTITAALVDWVVRARLAATRGTTPLPRERHVIVTGLGDVGSRIVQQLDDMGERVVAIERDENNPAVDLCRRRGIPVIIGDATRAGTLTRANVDTCRALVPVTSDDVANLEVALNARATRPELRVVLRLFDADLAARVEEHFGITTSRSVAYLAAPAFAAALVERQVINTIPVGRRVLVIADIPVNTGAPLAGQRVHMVEEPGETRVIALRTGDGEWMWAPAANRVLLPGERAIVLSTRTGLGRVLVRSEPPTPDAQTESALT